MSEIGKSVSVRDIAAKKGQERIVMLTAYDAPSARLRAATPPKTVQLAVMREHKEVTVAVMPELGEHADRNPPR